MTYSLPFGLKQKPLRHYFEGGSFSFECSEGKLFYRITITRKTQKLQYSRLRITNLNELIKLLQVKNESEIPLIEVVN